jgi:hypothetical protein
VKAILRNAILAAGAASSIVMTTTPAHAAIVAEFTGTAVVGCFGCGTSGPAGNSAELWVNGYVDGGVAGPAVGVNGDVKVTPSNASATFTVTESPMDPECVISGSASGTVTVQTNAGPKSANFTWTRTGVVAVISIPAYNGTGVAVFVVTDPVGVPCHHAVTAIVAGAIVGAP